MIMIVLGITNAELHPFIGACINGGLFCRVFIFFIFRLWHRLGLRLGSFG